MGFRIRVKKILRAPIKVAQIQAKIVKTVANNKIVQTAARAGAAYATGGASEAYLRGAKELQGRVRSLRGSAGGQAIESIANDVSSASQSGGQIPDAPMPSNTPSITSQARGIAPTLKNQESGGDSFVSKLIPESVSNIFSGKGEDGNSEGGGSKKIMIALAGLAVVFFVFKKKKA